MLAVNYDKKSCEYLRLQANQKFDKIRPTWLECGRWAAPHRIKWMLQQTPGERNNQHIVDSTHLLALRSYVAGFLEGNTSASRPWVRMQSKDPDKNQFPKIRAWLDKFTSRGLSVLGNSNFYHNSGQVYYDIGVFNTAGVFIEELENGLHFHSLIPGAYKVINNVYGEAVVLVREFSLTVKAVVSRYAEKRNGMWDYSNLSSRVQKCYTDGDYTTMIDIVQIIKENENFNPELPQTGLNRKWIALTYELSAPTNGSFTIGTENNGVVEHGTEDGKKFLEVKASRRKPFYIPTNDRSANFEYGEKGPTLDSLGLIKSLNKKAIGKDQALELMLKPPVQGPASLRKSYVSTSANTFIPLDANSAKQGGLKQVFEVNPGIGALIQDVNDLRQQVERFYYSDYLLFLSNNPKTRTARETDAVVQEQQLIIGPNLQSLNWTNNVPVVEFVMDYVLDLDPYLEEAPAELQGEFLRPEFISVFAQAQKAADVPNIDRFVDRMMAVAQFPGGEKVFDKVNLDKLADLYEDRFYLPTGLVNEQSKVDAQREQAMAMAQQQQMMNETVPALAGAASDLGMQMPSGEGE